MRTNCQCGATWVGLRIEHCTACHETFTGTTSGDRHRVGDSAVFAGPKRRRCLTPDEMRAKGMAQNERGQWTNGGESYWAKKTGCDGDCHEAGDGCAECGGITVLACGDCLAYAASDA